MSICIPGAVFSSLIFHLKNAPSDAEGFLFGSVRSHHVENITDSQSSGTREEKRMYVESFVSFSERFKFYDHYGQPHVDRIAVLLGEGAKRVVGWFSYRRNTSHRLSLREKVVHRRLTECLPNISSRDFLLGLVTEQIVEDCTVLSTDYSFYNWIGTSLKPVKVEIVNLRVTATVPYQQLPLTHIPPSLPHYSSALQQHRSKFAGTDGRMIQAQMSEQLYKAVLERLKPLCEQLTEASAAAVREGREVEQLEARLKELTCKPTREGTDDLTPCTDSTARMTSSVTHGNHREHIPTASLIDLEGGPLVTSSLQYNGPVGPVIDLTDRLKDQPAELLTNGDALLIKLSSDTATGGGGLVGKKVLGHAWPESTGEVVMGEEEGGVLMMSNPGAEEGVESEGVTEGGVLAVEPPSPGSQQELF